MTGLKFTKSAFVKAAVGDDSWYHKDGFELGAEQFLKSYYDDTARNDTLVLPLEDILALARRFWIFGDRRKIGTSSIRVEPITQVSSLVDRYDVVEIITDDRTFLVDSIVSEISSHGIDILALYHPMIEGYRNDVGLWRKRGAKVRESLIQVLIPRQSRQIHKSIKADITKTLGDLDAVISDFKPMLSLLADNIAELSEQHGDVPSDVLNEAIEFLDWIREGNFVLLGTRAFIYESGKAKNAGGKRRTYDYTHPKTVEGSCLGVLRDRSNLILRQSNEPARISSNIEASLQEKDPVTVAKSNLFSRVHRRVRMDYISIKKYNKLGKVIGETRIAGLFTVEAYARSPKHVPLIRRKVQQVVHRYGAALDSHNAKRLDFVLASYPRDELFQSSEDDLYRIATGIAQVFDQPRTRLFVRNDPFKRFVSVLIYVPRENYNATVRQRIGKCLREAWNGRVSAFYPQYSDSPMARVQFIIGLDPENDEAPDLIALEKEIAALSQPWSSGLHTHAEAHENPAISNRLNAYKSAFSAAYQANFDAAEAVEDIAIIEEIDTDNPTAVRVYKRKDDVVSVLRAKFYSWNQQLELSNIMPIFNNMGLHVVQETGYRISAEGSENVWVYDYEMRLDYTPKDRSEKDRSGLEEIFCDAFLSIWHGQNEDDGFNVLILPQAVHWRQVAVLRLLARYRKQSGLDPSEQVQIEALASYPKITGLMLALFHAKFEPASKMSQKISMEVRREKVAVIENKIFTQMDKVTSLDHDRVLRRMALVLQAALRTNFYITDKNGNPHPFISLKINSQAIEALPMPKPYREIFVWSPRVEGVHIRFGSVARGGLRWSDRRDDFRTEVLGLVKAQQVKNAVIVPVGSKGGFFPKKLPVGGNRDDVLAEGIAAYTQFISGLLDVTDTYKGKDTLVPTDVVCWDDPDPYLVVAADKGTATFSDIANDIAADYGFWLDDAFASGGSIGYDHKAMGITAKGGWEAVKRHFREMGKDIQTQEFDVIGIGDMSGDVFGNGMLLSKKIRLLAAFDHRDIFIDPDPDTVKTFKERERLFNVPRSSWQDYDKKLISKGGGIFPRSCKFIALTPEIQKLTGLSIVSVTPNELMKALLKSKCELLWFGGIGTYIKASSESHDDARDKANNLIRINSLDLQAKVIGEGANMGMTQAGRIEFAKNGGRINTDAIDNSAGVDCSDNEVNIKILLAGAIESGELKSSARVKLLEKMTDDISALVLRHNYDQTGALSLAQMHAHEEHHAYGRFMETLETAGKLDRDVEGLPSALEMRNIADKGGQLSRPEISVLNAYAKIVLFDDLVDTNVADDPFFEVILRDYFPKAVQGFNKAMANHRLRREIIISRLCNKIVDVGGPIFMSRLYEQTNGSAGEIAKAFIIAYEVLQIENMRTAINGLDNKISAKAQLSLQAEISTVLQRVIGWLVRRGETGTIEMRIARRTNGLANVDAGWVNVLSSYDSRRVTARIGQFIRSGIPEELAAEVSLLRARASGFDVVELTEKTGWPIRKSAELFYGIGGRFKIDRLRSMSMKTKPITHWEGLAQQRIEEDYYAAQASLALDAACLHIDGGWTATTGTKAMINTYIESKPHAVEAYDAAYSKINASGEWSLAKFAIVNTQLRELLAI